MHLRLVPRQCIHNYLCNLHSGAFTPAVDCSLSAVGLLAVITAAPEVHLQLERHLLLFCKVDLENWVEPARPLSQAEKDVAFVLDNKIFSVSPHSGSLQPGQKKQVGDYGLCS